MKFDMFIVGATGPRKAKASPASTRPRSLGGCGTCRNRHVKCDENRPSCLICRNLGLVCEGYEIRLVFDAVDAQGSRCRRPLFTEDLRQEMSEELIASVNPNDINTLLMRIDDRCEELEQLPGEVFDTCLGPFGAFRVMQSDTAVAETAPTFSAEQSPVYQDVPAGEDFGIAFEDSLINDPLLDCLFEGIDVHTTHGLQVGNLFSTTRHLPENNEFLSQSFVTEDSDLLGLPTLPGQIEHCSPVPNLAPLDAPLLLLEYKNNLVKIFSPVQSNKSPWQLLHVPSAMATLAQLTLGEQPGNASSCIFYAILATSAYVKDALSTQPVSHEHWQTQAMKYAGEAQRYLHKALQDVSTSEKRSKYKDILIALMSMSTVSAYQGNEDRIRRCLLDCENWICFRGIPKKRKSSKVRLLHHCYVYLRIFYESTSVSHLKCPSVQDPSTSPDTVTSMASSNSFRLRQWEDRLDQKMDELKEQHLGENDIHLEIPGRWESTMYPKVFGMPEPLLFLIAQVTRLGNERDMSELGTSVSILDFKQFSTRARSLERCICIWRPPPIPPYGEGGLEDSNDTWVCPSNSKSTRCMIVALHKALLIFFYRRIYDVDPIILQDKVWQVQESLAQCDDGDIPTAPMLWAAFIAACEALDSVLQSWFAQWLGRWCKASGLENFKNALEIAKKVWKKHQQPSNNDISPSWLKVMCESNKGLFYV
ncbi:fungal-specific transcription factor domain-containing protein [Aspergillus avenaceus]|uniref:Fungal-specific transcription factor domain-containing protein n=1 Tax=Aspergillus avenaceus TaxID=36643 RepID=A0A5N6TQP7_ASPAV|nr:fungal-specific transcription factor domain-containing protein [Aspergillus avenaceus]